MGRTVVFQSFRTHDVPPIIEAALPRARAWAQHIGADYVFYDDSFFDILPGWVFDSRWARHSKHRRTKFLFTDYARILHAKAFLEKGYEQAIWMDADVYIVRPESLKIPARETVFSREVTFAHRKSSLPYHLRKLDPNIKTCNCLCKFRSDSVFLNQYLADCETALRDADEDVSELAIGTDYLTRASRTGRFGMFTNVALLSPAVLLELANPPRLRRPYFVPAMLEHHELPIAAVNLTHSALGRKVFRKTLSPRIYQRALDAIRSGALDGA